MSDYFLLSMAECGRETVIWFQELMDYGSL